MIGLAINPEHRAAASEFFELFKVEWQFYRSGETYDVVVCCGAIPTDIQAKLVVVYTPDELPFDREHHFKVMRQDSGEVASYRGWRMPIFTGVAQVSNSVKRNDFVTEKTKSSLASKIETNDQTFVRVGYNLFVEVRHLLCNGQPTRFAHIPSLEIHITILRDILVEHGVPFEEIPPVPAGYNFIVCLTHDVDHFAIRNHWCDHTMFGFLYRASIGSFLEFFQGRKTLRQVARNCLAILSLPLVHLQIVPDFWNKLERYLELDRASTFFIIPKKGDAGLAVTDARFSRRAARYDLSQLRKSIDEILARGGEVAAHGIDAWCDTGEGKKEKEQIQALTRSPDVGVRMHWLFFDSESPGKLDETGFSYDSTVGYNETVGYRAGTTQAFRPLGTKRLLELPLHIMDTALFYPTHLNLSAEQAMIRMEGMVNDMRQFGGVLMINWHDRSIAPERLWDDFYIKLIEKLEAAGAWFCTAGQAAAWFRRRREVTFEISSTEITTTPADGKHDLPGFRIRSCRPGSASQTGASKQSSGNSSVLFDNQEQVATAL